MMQLSFYLAKKLPNPVSFKNEVLDLIKKIKIWFWESRAIDIKKYLINFKSWNFLVISGAFLLVFIFNANNSYIYQRIVSPLPLAPLAYGKGGYEVFGFAPFWNIDKLDNINFDVLTTLAYFGIPVDENGNLDQSDIGYQTFQSNKATRLFQKAHSFNTRVVLTLTQMDNNVILALMDNRDAQENLVKQAVELVKARGLDGINVDFEYSGNPGDDYRNKFSTFTENLTKAMHNKIPQSRVTVSVYASSVKDPKIYDLTSISKVTDGIFMMAYDFAIASSENAIPTSPLYGHKEGKYWYDIATAVDDFLTQMQPNKLILGLPLYGYNYPVYEPETNAPTIPYYYWYGAGVAQTYSFAKDNIKPDMPGVLNYKTGWDSAGQVGWKAYYTAATGWRMIFIEDEKSLKVKYDFAKNKNLAGVGFWALGNDEGKFELWSLLAKEFGTKLADRNISKYPVYENIN